MDKNTAQRLIDVTVTQVGVGDPIAFTDSVPLRRVDQYPAPSGLYIVNQSVYRNTSTPSVLVTFQWSAPLQVPYEYFILEIDDSSNFTTPETYTSATESASVVLPTNTTLYARVAAVSKTATSSYGSGISFTTIQDNTAPADISALTLAWSKGDLLITIPSQNTDLVKDTRIRIYNSAGSVLYKEEFATHTVRFSAEENQRLANNQIALQIQAQNRSWNNVYSVGTYTVNTTSPAPSGITNLTTNWAGDTGLESADCLITWDTQPQASAYIVSISGALFTAVGNSFNYTYTQNAQQYSQSGAARLPISVWPVNKLGQSGIRSTITAINQAPPTPTVALNQGFSTIVADIEGSQAKDFRAYVLDLYGSGGSGFQESSGQVVIEAENYTSKVDRSGSPWVLATSLGSYSGAGYMLAGTTQTSTPYETVNDQLNYLVNFQTTGTYYIWVRVYALNSSSDSLHAGVDGSGTATNMTGMPFTQWDWHEVVSGGGRATLTISTTGEHTVNIWSREANLAIDKILLTTDIGYTPTGTGPSESPSGSGGLVQRIITPDKLVTITPPESNTYYIQLYQQDMFGQLSSAATSETLSLDFVTLSGLRSNFRYTNSEGNSNLDGLKDGDLSTVVITHSNTTVGSRWTQGERDYVDRVKTITFAASGLATRIYFSVDNGDAVYYYGAPLTSGRIMTEYTTEASAQSNALTYSGITRYDLPTIREGRIFRAYHSIPTGTYGLNEFYPRRLVQSDDIEAESIKAINIAAGNITADKINVAQLSAISANMGTVTAGTISGLSILGGTVTGSTIQTAQTGARIVLTSVSGIQTFNSGGTQQIRLDTTLGELTAGRVKLSASGITLSTTPTSLPDAIDMLKYNDGAREIMSLYANKDNPTSYAGQLYLNRALANVDVSLTITANAGSSYAGDVYISALSNSAGTIARLSTAGLSISTTSALPAATLDVYRGTLGGGTAQFRGTTYNSHFNYSVGEDTYIRGGLLNSSIYVGDTNTTGTGFTAIYGGTGGITLNTNNTTAIQISSAQNVGISRTPGSVTRLIVNAGGTTGSYWTASFRNSSDTELMYVRADGQLGANQNWTIFSSQDIKENIEDLQLADVVRILRNVRPRKYNLIGQLKKHYGLVLEELPIDADDLKEMGGIRYGDFIAPLILAVRYLYEEVQKLKQR